MKNLGILVGIGFDFEFGGQEKIASELESRGHSVKLISSPWPRNYYVYFNGKYVFEEKGDSTNVFGNGGMVQKGGNFLLVSDAAFFYKNFKSQVDVNRLKIDKDYYEDSKKLIIDAGKKEFDSNIHVAPTGNFFNMNLNGDIDLYTLLLPKEKIMIFDNYFGNGANKFKDYNMIAEKEKWKFIEYNGNQDGVWYPLNALVLPSEFQDSVVLDKNAKSLIKLLEKHRIKTIPIDMPQRHNPAGKINCQTNVFGIENKSKIEGIF